MKKVVIIVELPYSFSKTKKAWFKILDVFFNSFLKKSSKSKSSILMRLFEIIFEQPRKNVVLKFLNLLNSLIEPVRKDFSKRLSILIISDYPPKKTIFFKDQIKFKLKNSHFSSCSYNYLAHEAFMLTKKVLNDQALLFSDPIFSSVCATDIYDGLFEMLSNTYLVDKVIKIEKPDTILLYSDNYLLSLLVSYICRVNHVRFKSLPPLLIYGVFYFFKDIILHFKTTKLIEEIDFSAKVNGIDFPAKKEKTKRIIFFTPGPAPLQTAIPLVKDLINSINCEYLFIIPKWLISSPKTKELIFKNKVPYIVLEDLYKYHPNAYQILIELKKKSGLQKSKIKKIKYKLRYNKYDLGVFFKKYLVSYYKKQAVRVGFYIELLKNVIDLYKPDLVISIHDLWWLGRIPVAVAKSYNIPTLSIQDGVFFDSGHLGLLLADKIAVYGEYVKDVMKKYDISEERIIISGQPRYDKIPELKKKFDKQQIFKELNLDPNKKLILYTTQYLPLYEKQALMKAILNAINKIAFAQLLIKVHPSEKEEFYYEMIKELKTKNVIIVKEFPVLDLIMACDVLITKHSTTALEAIILNKPVVIMNLTNEFIPYVESGLVIEVTSADNVYPAILNAFNIYKTASSQKLRTSFLNSHIYKVDGNASKRIVNEIKKLIS